jgi:hypothetical protein
MLTAPKIVTVAIQIVEATVCIVMTMPVLPVTGEAKMRGKTVGFATIACLIVTVWMCLGSGCVCRCVAADVGYTQGYTPQPPLETAPGQSLYWHNPCEQAENPCEPRMCWTGSHPGMSPGWYASGEFLGLFRHQDNVPFQALQPLPQMATGTVVLGTPDFDVEMASGTRVLLGFSLGEWYRIEGSYLGSHSWSDSVAVRNTDPNTQGGSGTLFSPFSDFGVPDGILGLDYNNYASIAFTSRLNSAEINVRRRLAHTYGGEHHAEASAILGLRYVNVAETFHYFTQANVPAPQGANNDVDISADNDLFGVQIGCLSQLLMRERAWIDFETKGGIFLNRTGQQTVYTNVNSDGVTTTAAFGDTEDATSFLLDLGGTLNIQFAPSFTFRVGYNAIFLWDVAVAAENFNTDVNMLLWGPADVNHGGNLVYHGPSVGFIWTR